MSRLQLSVLDQTPVPEGSDARTALANTVDLAQHCEAFGYNRYWVSEHHNSTGLAGAAPEILVGQIAANTKTIRVGSGGVMLSHYAPYKVAETFKLLATMFPDRIDLGVGRAPGSDPVTMYALANSDKLRPVDEYPDMVRDLLGFLDDTLPKNSPYAGRVRAVPTSTVTSPPVWLLASSPDSASFAAQFGLPLGWAHFFSPVDGSPIVDAYRREYQPSERFPEPIVSITAAAICADTEVEAVRLGTSVATWRQRGLGGPIPKPSGIWSAPGAPESPLTIRNGQRPIVAGTAEQVMTELEVLADLYGTDDVTVVSIVWDHQARVRSYELLAEANRG